MALQRIDSIYDTAAIQQEANIVANTLTKSQAQIVELYNTINQYKSAGFTQAADEVNVLNNQIKSSTQLTTQLTGTNRKLEASMKDVAKATTSSKITDQDLAKAKADLIKKQSEQNVKLQGYKLQSAEATKAAKEEARTALGLIDAYGKLTNQYNAAQRNAKNLAVEFGRESVEAKEAAATALKLNAELQAIDKTVGQSQKNVGNYGSAFSKAFGSLRTLAQILPGIGIAGLFGLAFEGISKLASGLDLFSSKATTTSLSAKLINDSLTDTSGIVVEAYKNIDTLNSYVGLAKEGLAKKDSVVKFYNETMGTVTGTVKTFSEVEAKLSDKQAVKDYTDAMLFRAAANLALEEAAKAALQAEKDRIEDQDRVVRLTAQNTKKGRDAEERGLDQFLERTAKTQSVADEKAGQEKVDTATKVANILNEKSAAIYKKYGTQFIKDEDDKNKKVQDFVFERNKLILEDEIKTQEAIAANSLIAFPLRNAAAQAASDLRIKLINYTTDYEKKQEGVTADQVKFIDTQKYIALTENASKYNQALQGILADRAKIQQEISAEEKKILDEAVKYFENQQKILESERPDTAGLVQDEIKQQENILTARLSLISQNKDKEETVLNNKRAAGKIGEEQYQRDLLAIQKKYLLQALQAQKIAAEAELKLLEAKGLAGTVQADKLREAIAAANLGISKLGAGANEGLLRLQKTLETVSSAIQTVGQLLTDAANIGYQNQLNAIQELEDAQQKNYDQQVQRINDSTLTEEDKANRLKILDAQRQIDEDTNERKRREAQQKQARFEKAINIASIIGTTALAVVRALAAYPGPPFTIPSAIAAGVLGAAQLAIAIATPIPQYKSGTSSSKQGWALTDEAGAEGYIEPGGKAYVGNDSPTLRYLKAGTRIIPHDKMQQSAAFVDANGILRMKSAPAGNNNDSRNTDRLIKAIRGSRPIIKNNIRVDGNFNAYINSMVRQ